MQIEQGRLRPPERQVSLFFLKNRFPFRFREGGFGLSVFVNFGFNFHFRPLKYLYIRLSKFI